MTPKLLADPRLILPLDLPSVSTIARASATLGRSSGRIRRGSARSLGVMGVPGVWRAGSHHPKKDADPRELKAKHVE